MSAPSEITTAAVIGAGYMGGGIAQVLAMAGVRVALADVDAATSEANLRRLIAEAETFEQQGLLPPGSAKTVAENLWAADSIAEAVADAGFVEEAVSESPAVKTKVLAAVEESAPAEAIIGTNTSTLPIGELASTLRHPGRFLGVHFANPAPFVPGVEIITHEGSDEGVVTTLRSLLTRAGKVPALVGDAAGFVINRLQYVLLKEAIDLVAEGVATAENVDLVVRTTFGFRLAFFGPFTIADMAGLDVYRAAFGILAEHFGDRLTAPPSLNELVDAGKYGVKQGGGFVVPAGDPTPLINYRNQAYVRLTELLHELGPVPEVRTDDQKGSA